MSMRYWSIRSVAAVLALGLAGCGTDEESSNNNNNNNNNNTPKFNAVNCETYTFTACGGDVVGTWTFKQSCPAALADMTEPIDEDPACDTSLATYDVPDNLSMTVDIKADGTYTATVSPFDIDITAVVTEECVDAMMQSSMTLADFCALFQSNLFQNNNGTCAVNGTQCECDGAMNIEGNTEPGTYTIAGQSMTITPDDPNESPRTNPYCVSSNGLVLEETEQDNSKSYTFLWK